MNRVLVSNRHFSHFGWPKFNDRLLESVRNEFLPHFQLFFFSCLLTRLAASQYITITDISFEWLYDHIQTHHRSFFRSFSMTLLHQWGQECWDVACYQSERQSPMLCAAIFIIIIRAWTLLHVISRETARSFSCEQKRAHSKPFH